MGNARSCEGRSKTFRSLEDEGEPSPWAGEEELSGASPQEAAGHIIRRKAVCWLPDLQGPQRITTVRTSAATKTLNILCFLSYELPGS